MCHKSTLCYNVHFRVCKALQTAVPNGRCALPKPQVPHINRLIIVVIMNPFKRCSFMNELCKALDGFTVSATAKPCSLLYWYCGFDSHLSTCFGINLCLVLVVCWSFRTCFCLWPRFCLSSLYICLNSVLKDLKGLTAHAPAYSPLPCSMTSWHDTYYTLYIIWYITIYVYKNILFLLIT